MTRHWARALAPTLLLSFVVACSSADPEDPAAFCDALGGASTGASTVANVDLDDAESVDAALAELDRLAEMAPEEVVADVELVNAVYREVLTALATTAPGVRDDMLRDMQPRLDEARAPSAALEAYATSTCALEFEGAPVPTPTPTPVDVED